jgi:DNA-binding SARP family transcriptional activator
LLVPCVSAPTDGIDAPIPTTLVGLDAPVVPRRGVDRARPRVATVRAHLLGSFRMEVDGREVVWPGARSRSVVQHLVVAGRPVHRDVLMDRLWPQFDADRARNNLNVALAGARRALDDADRRIIVHSHGAYGFGPAVKLWVDVLEFERHAHLGHLNDREGDAGAAVQEYLAAIELYRGDLLVDELYAEGLAAERAYYRTTYSDALKRLTELLLEGDQLREASWTCQLGLRHDDLDEEFVALWVQCLSRRGQRALLVKEFEQFRLRAQREVGAAPSSALRALVTDLMAQGA